MGLSFKTGLLNVFTVYLLVMGLTGCSKKQDIAPSDSRPVGPTLGLKNLREIYETMISVTGYPTDHLTRRFYFGSVQTFSQDGRGEKVSAPMMMRLTSMAGLFCNHLIVEERKLTGTNVSTRKFFKKVQFDKDSSYLTPEVREDVLQNYAEFFWRREISEKEKALLNQLLENSIEQQKSDTKKPDQPLLATCTAALSSLKVFTN